MTSATPEPLPPALLTEATARMAAYLADQTAPCERCGHQNGVHTGGSRRGGWAIYEPVWRDASGACNTLGCTCPARLPAAVPVPHHFRPIVWRKAS